MRIPPVLVFATWLAGAMLSSNSAGAFTPLAPAAIMTQRHTIRSRFLPFPMSTGSNNNNNNETPAQAKQEDAVFVNDGPFSFMEPYLDTIGFKQGRQIVGAIPQEANVFMTDEEAERRRLQAEMEMVNISMEERQRRKDIGKVAAYVSALYIGWATLIGDQGDLFGHLLRFASCIPLFFAWGFYVSGKQGL